MELLLGFPLSLAFALIPIYLYRASFNRRFWLWGMFAVTCLFLFIPAKMRIVAFMPMGAAVFFFIAGIWVVALNPNSSIFKLLNMPLPSRRELKAEIEKIPDVEGRLAKYLALTLQLKKIWQKRDAFLSGYNSALLLIFTILSTILSYSVAIYDYFGTKVLQQMWDEQLNLWAPGLKAAGVEIADFRAQVIDISPIMFFVWSFVGVLCLGAFLRLFARIRFKQNIVQGHMSLFRIPDTWVWALVAFAGFFVAGLKMPALAPFMFFIKNGLLILLFLYMLQGIGIASLFFEVRLLPGHWLTLGIMLAAVWVREMLPLIAIIFTVLGLMEVWLALRKRSLRPVTDVNQG